MYSKSEKNFITSRSLNRHAIEKTAEVLRLKHNKRTSNTGYKSIPTYLVFKDRIPEISTRERELLLILYLMEFEGGVHYNNVFQKCHLGFGATQLKAKLKVLREKGYVTYETLPGFICLNKAKFDGKSHFNVWNEFVKDLNISAKHMMILAFFMVKPTGGFISFIAKKIGVDPKPLKHALAYLIRREFLEKVDAPEGLAGIAKRFKTCDFIYIAKKYIRCKFRAKASVIYPQVVPKDKIGKSNKTLSSSSSKNKINVLKEFLIQKSKEKVRKSLYMVVKDKKSEGSRGMLTTLSMIAHCSDIKKFNEWQNLIGGYIGSETFKVLKAEITNAFDTFMLKFSKLLDLDRKRCSPKKVKNIKVESISENARLMLEQEAADARKASVVRKFRIAAQNKLKEEGVLTKPKDLTSFLSDYLNKNNKLCN